MRGHLGWKVGWPKDRHSVETGCFARSGHLTITASLGCEVHNHTPRLHTLDHCFSNQYWCRFAWYEGRGNNKIAFCYDFAKLFLLLFIELFSHGFGVSTLGFTRFRFQVELNEFCSETLYLLFHCRPNVISKNLCTKPLGCCDRLKPRDASSKNEYLGRTNCSSRGCHHWQDFLERSSSEKDSFVSCNICLA